MKKIENNKLIENRNSRNNRNTVYIRGIKASFLLNNIDEKNKKEICKKGLNANAENTEIRVTASRVNKFTYKESIPNSLFLRYLKAENENSFFENKENCFQKVCSDAIINIDFGDTETYIIKKRLKKKAKCRKCKKLIIKDKAKLNPVKGRELQRMSMKQLDARKILYKNGFYVGDKHYIQLVRTSSKAKQGECLFIDEALASDALNWLRMGLPFVEGETCDIASLCAYETLTLSGIESTLEILPENILLIDDYKSTFSEKASVSFINDFGELQTKTQLQEQTSDIWDGQALIDISLLPEEYKDKGCVLLRNHFFKSCAFNCNMQLFFKDNDIKELTDMFGVAHQAENIKLITTPNSLKALKFAYKVEKGTKEAMFNYWKASLLKSNTPFGVVKSEKGTKLFVLDDEGKKETKQRLSYQMINSLPLSSEEVRMLCKDSVEHINKLNNDVEYYCKTQKIDIEEPEHNSCVYSGLIGVNSDIQFTQEFKNARKEYVKKQKEKLSKGNVLVDGDYAVMVSNPVEMLRTACGIEWSDPIHGAYELHTTLFDDGAELAGFRNPHIASGNVCVFKNKRKPEIDKYMNLTANITVVNSYKNDMMARLQGCDYDSDTVLLTDNKVILKAALECRSFPTPLNNIEMKKKERKLSFEDMAEVDDIISNNFIGSVCNYAQLFQSNYWHYKVNGKEPKYLDDIYSKVSLLSSLSQLEIDKAKHFTEIDTKEELAKIKNAAFLIDEEREKENLYYELKSEEKKLLLELGELKKKYELLGAEYEQKFNNDSSIQSVEYVKGCLKKQLNQGEISREYFLEIMDELNRKVDIKELKKNNREIKQKIENADVYIKIQKKKKELKKIKNQIMRIKRAEKILLKVGDDKKIIYPLFFRHIKESNQIMMVSFKTPMDYLQAIVGDGIPKARATKTLLLSDLLVKNEKGSTDKGNSRQADTVKRLIVDAFDSVEELKKNNGIFIKNGLSDYDRNKKYYLEKAELIENTCRTLQEIKISSFITIRRVLKSFLGDEELKNYRNFCLFLLWKTQRTKLIECFRMAE